nr:uncharacterized protein LOC125422765 [Ziziphus jujuba var. spinosa]
MGPDQLGFIPLHESLKTLSLQPRTQGGELTCNRVLVGKLLSTCTFHGSLGEIISKTWNLMGKVKIEKLEENIFKFSFEQSGEKERIFKSRPWTFNGAHIILKEWPETLALSEISFKFSTFTVQIHGLPPIYLHTEAAFQIGARLGKVVKESITRKSVVSQRFLRFKVDIDTDNPLPAGFFLERAEGDELWVQFKFERLSDFCYKCGRLSHVTGKCLFEKPAMIRASTGIETRLYGSWIRSETSGSLQFVNQPMAINEEIHLNKQASQIESREIIIPNNSRLTDIVHKSQAELEEKGNSSSNLCQTWKKKDFETIKELCPEVDALSLTLKRHDLNFEKELQEEVLQRFKSPKFNVLGLSNWAASIIKSIATSKDTERKEIDSLDSGFLETIGLGPPALVKASGKQICSIDLHKSISTQKRPAPVALCGPPRSYLRLE